MILRASLGVTFGLGVYFGWDGVQNFCCAVSYVDAGCLSRARRRAVTAFFAMVPKDCCDGDC